MFRAINYITSPRGGKKEKKKKKKKKKERKKKKKKRMEFFEYLGACGVTISDRDQTLKANSITIDFFRRISTRYPSAFWYFVNKITLPD